MVQLCQLTMMMINQSRPKIVQSEHFSSLVCCISLSLNRLGSYDTLSRWSTQVGHDVIRSKRSEPHGKNDVLVINGMDTGGCPPGYLNTEGSNTGNLNRNLCHRSFYRGIVLSATERYILLRLGRSFEMLASCRLLLLPLIM